MAQRHVIDELVTLISLQFSPETRREIQRIERSLAEFKSSVQQTLQRAGLAMDDFSDDVSDMSRESRSDLDRTGRATDRLSRDVADMSQKADRELERTQRSFSEFAGQAQKAATTVGAALGTLASAFVLKETVDFRAEIARIDNQLRNLNFKQVENAVIGVSDAFSIAPDIVAEFAHQIPNALANTPEEFAETLARSVKLFKARGRGSEPIELQNLLNIGNLRLPRELRDDFTEQLNRLIADNPVLHDSFDEISEGLTEALSGKTTVEEMKAAIADFFALLDAGVTKAGRDISNIAVSELERDIRTAVERGFTRAQVLLGDPAAVEGLTAGSMDYLSILRAEGDAVEIVNTSLEKFVDITPAIDANLQNIERATGGLTRWMVWLQNRAIQTGGVLLDLGGALVGILPAIGGAALTLQGLGFDLSGVGKAIRAFASAIRHPVQSLQRFWMWLKTSTIAVRTFAKNLWAGAIRALTNFATSIRATVIPALTRFAATIWTSSVVALRAFVAQVAAAAMTTLRFSGRAIVAGIAGVVAFAASIWTAAVPALAAFAAGVWATTVALLANPIGLIIVAIAGLIAGLVALVIHWDTVKRVVKDFFDRFGNYILAALAVVAPFIGVPLLIAKNWGRIVEIVGGIWSRVNDTVRGWIEAIIAFITELPGRVLGVVKDIPGMVAEAIRDIPGLGGAIEVVAGAAGKAREVLRFAQGGVVPGPVGRPALSLVHGGEMVLPPASAGALSQLLEGFRLGPAALPTAPAGAATIYRSSVTNQSTTVEINGPITINTQATTAREIAQQLGQEIQDQVRNIAFDHDGPVDR